MESIVIAITVASAIQLGERSIKLLLKNNKNLDLILSKGAYEVSKSERNINIFVEPKAQNQLLSERLNTQNGELNCYRLNDHAAPIASGSNKTKGMVMVPPILAWYTNPSTIDEMIDFIVVRLFDSLGEDFGLINRWTGPNK